jgi:O-antigen ligase
VTVVLRPTADVAPPRPPARSRLAAWLRPALPALAILVAGGLLGGQLSHFPSLSPPLYLAGSLSTIVIGYLFVRDPRWPLVALLGITLFALYRRGLAAGPISLRPTDLAYVAIVGWSVVLRSRQGSGSLSPVGQKHLCALIGVFLLTLLPLLARSPGDFADAFVSWLRLAQTASLVWLVPHALPGAPGRRFLVNAIAFLSAMELVRVIIYTGLHGDLGARLFGGNGPNADGLLAALLIVISLHSPVPERRWLRIAYGLIGVVALVMAQSIASMAALGLTLGICGLSRSSGQRQRSSALFLPIRLSLLIVGVIAMVGVLRGRDVPSAQEFDNSSTTQRIVLGSAGLEVFAQHPLVGVGWGRSSDPDVIGAPDIAAEMRQRFPDVNPDFYPDIRPGSVHNAYVQVLAETGLVGSCLLIATIVTMRRRVRSIVARARGTDRDLARTAAMSLLLLLIWWNNNPLFGAQPETVLAAVFLGLLASYRQVGPTNQQDEIFGIAGNLSHRPQDNEPGPVTSHR